MQCMAIKHALQKLLFLMIMQTKSDPNIKRSIQQSLEFIEKQRMQDSNQE